MIKRLWHFWVVGHHWRVRWAHFNPGVMNKLTTYTAPDCENSKQGLWGFTEIGMGCDCGAFKRLRLLGDHVTGNELAELERLVKLEG